MLQVPTAVSRRVVLSVLLTCGTLAHVTSRPALANSPAPEQHDVVVYGATSDGVIASIAAANARMSVILLEPRRWVGGMVTGGLGWTDHGNRAVVGDMSREFFEHVGKRYGKDIEWYFEPHVADEVFHEWLEEAGVTVRLEQRVQSLHSQGRRVRTIEMESGEVHAATVFIDAS